MVRDLRPFHRDPLAVYDALGRKQPKRAGGVMELLRGMPWLMAAFDGSVPSEFYAREGDDVIVACPCGANPEPRVPFNVATKCAGETCGRWFFYDGDTVRVATEADPSTPVVH